MTRLIEPYTQKEDSQVRPRIHWCPTGAFVFAPVHAAGIYEGPDQECCSDYVISSYTPTLTALLRSQQRRETYTAQNMQVLTIAVERSQDDTLPRLRFVSTEARQIAELAEEAGVPVESVPETTPKSEVVKSFRATNMVHLSCHGIQDSLRPHESRFCLGSGNLTISELIDVDSEKSFFAFLSACETAKGSHKHADEVVHLAASMLFAGFKSVVATMW
jgi:CHAT domain-containing protein